MFDVAVVVQLFAALADKLVGSEPLERLMLVVRSVSFVVLSGWSCTVFEVSMVSSV